MVKAKTNNGFDNCGQTPSAPIPIPGRAKKIGEKSHLASGDREKPQKDNLYIGSPKSAERKEFSAFVQSFSTSLSAVPHTPDEYEELFKTDLNELIWSNFDDQESPFECS